MVHLQDLLDDLLLVIKTSLQVLHVELEEVKRGGACSGEGGVTMETVIMYMHSTRKCQGIYPPVQACFN